MQWPLKQLTHYPVHVVFDFCFFCKFLVYYEIFAFFQKFGHVTNIFAFLEKNYWGDNFLAWEAKKLLWDLLFSGKGKKFVTWPNFCKNSKILSHGRHRCRKAKLKKPIGTGPDMKMFFEVNWTSSICLMANVNWKIDDGVGYKNTE